jgi:hypothetical protein
MQTVKRHSKYKNRLLPVVFHRLKQFYYLRHLSYRKYVLLTQFMILHTPLDGNLVRLIREYNRLIFFFIKNRLTITPSRSGPQMSVSIDRMLENW